MGTIIEFTMHPQVLSTGKEVLFFSKKDRLLLVAKSGGAQGRSRVYAFSPQGLIDLNIELKSFQFNTLISVIERLKRRPSIKEWRTLLRTAAKNFNFMKGGAHEGRDKKPA
ncbi:hypothetical protein LCGC14_2343630 [marine sediment metagenome]|uniref:Uncharacterized protein n=1 Tax=marine sediment metagenome TaxID=412755 RepID=A0A0F9CYV7_9ZZZZ